MRENDLQRKCISWVRSTYGGRLLAVNVHGDGYANKGFPDLLVIGYGRVVAVELKSDSGYKLQPDQQVWRNRFRAAATPHYVIEADLEEFEAVIRKEFGK